MRLKATSYEFEVNANWQNDLTSLASAPGLRQVIVVSPPAAMRGDEVETAWSPEHLLLAAESCCFLNTFQALAGNEGFQYQGLECPAKGTIRYTDGHFEFTQIHISPRIVLNADSDEGKARQLAEKAKHYCLISNSLKCAVDMEFSCRSVELGAGSPG